MSEKYESFAALIDAWTWGIGSAFVAAFFGRMSWVVGQVRKGHRRFWSLHLLWELPIMFAMVIIGDAISAAMGFRQPVSAGVVTALAYLGPRGVEVLFMKWFDRRLEKT
ncbi:MAG: hypothetical protein DI589_25645 [Shinella sp.]|jgi:hypothetical protein|nr:MAG: hypothetical protein DI589_25645 [Shinella sp.]